MDDIGESLCNILERIYSINNDETTYTGFEEDDVKPYTIDGVPVRKLFVANLAQRTTPTDLKKKFQIYGEIENLYLKRNVGKSNFAFVTFTTVENALKASKDGRKKRINLHNRDLRVLPADSWHQPDSVERMAKRLNCSKANKAQENTVTVYDLNDDAAIHRLNDDCLIHIFQYLPIVDRIRIERVCKRWKNVSLASWQSFRKLDLNPSSWGFRLVESEAPTEINTPSLRKVLLRCGFFLNNLELTSKCHKLSKTTMTVIAKLCPNLQVIDITGLNVSPSGIESLTENCRNITDFSLGNCTTTCDNKLASLFERNKKLKSLRVISNIMNGKCLASLPFDTIEVIHLNDCSYLASCHLLMSLPKFVNLRTLKIENCMNIDDEAAKAIGSCLSLNELHMRSYFPLLREDVKEGGLNCITQLTNLAVLNLSENNAVTDGLLKAISSKCKELLFVDLSNCRALTNVGVSAIACLPKLETLKLSYLSKITDDALSDLPNLKTLECRRCDNIKDKGLLTLIEISQNIELLDVSSCKNVTNELINVAVKAMKNRTNNKILKMYVGQSGVNINDIKEVSPFLQVINVDLARPLKNCLPDFLLSEDEDDDDDDMNFDLVSLDDDDDMYYRYQYGFYDSDDEDFLDYDIYGGFMVADNVDLI